MNRNIRTQLVRKQVRQFLENRHQLETPVPQKIDKYSTHIASINEHIKSDEYLSVARSTALAEAREMIVSNISYCTDKHSFVPSDFMESESCEALKFEKTLMAQKAKQLIDGDELSDFAKAIANYFTGYDSDKYAQTLLFSCMYELAQIYLNSGDEDYQDEAYEMAMELVDQNISPKKMIAMVRENSDMAQSHKTLQVLRKARASGDPDLIIDAIGSALSIMFGGNASDLSRKVKLEGTYES
ncbi:hypothetical protein BIY22_03395 [Vibrio panuliri]|uniref:Uncharacterized protein n=1 Tax=Vibrio panuliri TaxID=1381081 RepID=A0A1Q9HRR6_9VIBR|nr:hypothetical protein [Vibrio panuliri]OLQ93550.1 hypothetical protein BIY22_03395 [Vibrio panuliri]